MKGVVDATPKSQKINISQGLGNDFQVGWGGWGGMGTATRKLPTPKFKFVLGFRPLYFGNAHAKKQS